MQRNWEDLAQAIVMQAVKDYRLALKVLRRRPDSKRAQEVVEEIERFIRSRWFSLMYDIDPEQIINRLKEEAA